GWLDRVLDDSVLPPVLSRFARCLMVAGACILAARVVLGVAPASWWTILQSRSGTPQAFLSAGTMLGLAMLVTAVPAARRRDAERLGSVFVLVLVIGGVACGQVAALGARRALETSRDVARAVDVVRAPGDVVVADG